MVVRIAGAYNLPVFNLAYLSHCELVEGWKASA